MRYSYFDNAYEKYLGTANPYVYTPPTVIPEPEPEPVKRVVVPNFDEANPMELVGIRKHNMAPDDDMEKKDYIKMFG